MIEMYLEGLVDLLKTVPGAEQVGKLDRKGQLAVRKDAHGRVQVGVG